MLIVYNKPKIKYYFKGMGFLASFCIFDLKNENSAQNNDDTQIQRSGNLNLSF